MSDSPVAGSAPARFASIDLMCDLEEVRIALLRLVIATRLHLTEIEESAKARLEPYDIRLAWSQANTMTVQALAQLKPAFDRIHRQRRSILAAVHAAEPAVIPRGTT